MSRDLKIVSAAMLLWGLGEGMFYIFQPLYIQQLGADPILIGAILGVNGLVMTLSQIPSGYLADKIGRRPLMWFSFFFGVLATCLMAWAPSLGFFVGGLLMYGLTSSVMAPLNTYVQGARGKWSVGRAVSFVSSAYNVGGILGPILGGLLGGLTNLRIVYFISAGVFAVSTVVILFAGDQTIEKVPHMEGDGHLLQNKRFLGMLGVILLIMFAVILPQPLASNFLQNERNLSLNQIGQLGSLGALGSVLLMLIFGHMQAGSALAVGQASVMVFSLLLWQGTGMLWFGIGHFFLGGFRLCRAMTVALVRPVVREREVGLAFGIVESLNSLAMMAAPVAAGFLYDRDPVLVFPVSLGVLAFSIVITVLLKRKQGVVEIEDHNDEKQEASEDA